MYQNQKTTLGYILKGYPRISETFISNEILLLEQLGFNLRLFPMRHPRENFSHDSIKKVKAQVDYLPTELLQEFNRLLIPNIFLAAKKPKEFIKTYKFASKKFRKNRNLATLKHLLQAGYLTNNLLEKDKSVQHLHGHFAHSPTSVTMFTSMLSGLPFSFTAHAKDIYTSNPKHLREKIDLAKFVTTCTKHNAEYLNNLTEGCSTPIYTVYHGIDTRLFDSKGASTAPAEPYQIMTIARLTEKKGLPTIYKALAILRDKGISFNHILIGSGDDKEAVQQIISELQLQENCQLLGTQTHTQVLDYFRKSDLFVLGCEIAKSGDRDGIPNVIVESLAMGVPAISTNVSAIPEIIEHNSTGLIVPPSDSKSMAAGIERLLTDHKLREKCITTGQKRIKSGFDNQTWTKQLAEIFQQENPALRAHLIN